MFRRTKWLMGVLVMVLILGTVPVHAQDGGGLTPEQQEWVGLVASAYNNLATAGAYQVASTQTLNQTVASGEGLLAINLQHTVNVTVSGEVQVGSEEQVSSSRMSVVQEAGILLPNSLQTINSFTEVEVIQVGEKVYLRTVRVSDNLPLSPVPNWIEVNEDPAAFSGYENLNIAALLSLNYGEFITPENVLTITQGEVDVLAGQPVQIYQLTLNAAAMGEAINLAGLFNETEVDLEGIIAALLAGTTIEQTVWVGIDTNLLYKVDTVVNINAELSGDLVGGDAFTLTQNATTSTTLSAFGEPVDIRAPEFDFGG